MPTDSQNPDQPSLRIIIDQRVADGSLTNDPAQNGAITFLDELLTQLNTPAINTKKSALGWLFGKKPVVTGGKDSIRGLYLWGGVGRGKSMLMDLFYDLAPTQPKKRVHFHAFMQDVHSRIHKWRQEQKSAKDRSADPIPPLAKDLANEALLLCFDEFAVTDVADAMILARLFTALFDHGVVVVATSNVVPDNLYKDGLNRSFFLPFIELIKKRMQVMELVSDKDHRMEKLINQNVYFVDHHSGFDELWKGMTENLIIEPATLEVKGRTNNYPHTSGGMVRETFSNLCEKPMGAGDYLALTERFHTIFLEAVPIMEHADRNALKRFIALIDTIYDTGRMLIVSAQERPSKLYPVDHGTEAFEFQRTISRLREMQSDEWLERGGS